VFNTSSPKGGLVNLTGAAVLRYTTIWAAYRPLRRLKIHLQDFLTVAGQAESSPATWIVGSSGKHTPRLSTCP
jgi:hypothetical protein